LELEIINDCSDFYIGEKYFRIHQFIWESLNELYLWQGEVEDLSDNIKPLGSAAYNELISANPEPESFFESLKHPDDKHSRIRSNFEDLENSIKGIDASNGVEFILLPSGLDNGVLGVVTHILENSDAFSKNIKRGDIFMGVNGQSLTFNNFYNLLFDNKTSYTLNMAKKINNGFILNGNDVNLIKEENFQTNPIQINKVIQRDGKKIAYLMYTQFSQGFDQELNSIFSEFKTEGVDELILDLRYNGGGLTQTALYLSGMITGQFTGQIFSQKIWNKKVTDYYESINNTEWMKDLFVSEMDDKTVINSLNLNRVYIITSGNSASASEMVINGLSPFIKVIQIGQTTYGKNVGGLAVVYDYIDNTNRTINPDHSYAISPITFSVANSEGFSDYADGLTPSDGFVLSEDVLNMGVLGEYNEPLLALALNDISGNSARKPIFIPKFPIENIISDPDFQKSSLLFMFQEDIP
jgi:C-terminal processing protease CtpA/Prc